MDHPNYENFQRDLSVIGLRQRRVHDARRSFVCLSLADGARRDILRWITHGPEGDIVSLYTTLPWDALCAEVAKLKIDVRAGQNFSSCARPRVQAGTQAEATGIYYRAYYSRSAATEKPRVPRAGLEPN